MRNICVRARSAGTELRTCFRVECKTATGSACARTRAANAYTNSFIDTQMFVQARNKKCLQHVEY